MNSAMKIGWDWARSIHPLWVVNTSLAIVAIRSRSCESNSIRPRQTVISPRARSIGRTRPRIAYTLIDEYEAKYIIRPARTARPLALGQLITLLDSVDSDLADRDWLRHGWVLSFNESNRSCDNGDPGSYRDFTRVSSEFYPELSKHYERLFDRWAQAYRITDEESDA
jgi:hypothetical protein